MQEVVRDAVPAWPRCVLNHHHHPTILSHHPHPTITIPPSPSHPSRARLAVPGLSGEVREQHNGCQGV